IAQALDGADEFVTETNTEDADFQALAAHYGTLPAGQALSSLLDAENAARLARVAAEVDLDMAQVERMRPWLAALNITYLYAARAGHSVDAGVESVLGTRARAAGKRFSYLETAEAQIRVLADLSPTDEAHFLAVTLRQLESGSDQMSAFDEPWAHGDLVTLSERLDADWAEAGPAVHDAIIVRRNLAWADEIERRLAGAGSAFITVGAAHLVGEQNVVTLLRERGIVVEGP
ncbi:MAG: TraB/GumN family protein, partial [Hyphomonadaceae bacterium]|nr:TraB/GumN family protein [Hyphomonadaceae bacterium]